MHLPVQAFEYKDNESYPIIQETIVQCIVLTCGRELFAGDGFICGFGCNIYLDDNVSINYRCTFIDCNTIRIGNNVLIAPGVQINPASHPVEWEGRATPDSMRRNITVSVSSRKITYNNGCCCNCCCNDNCIITYIHHDCAQQACCDQSLTPLWGQAAWNEFHALYYYADYLGYVVLAHYIRFLMNWSAKKSFAVGIPLLIIGYALSAGTWYDHAGIPDDYAYVEHPWHL